LIKRILIN